MSRNREGLRKALKEIPPLREEFWRNVNILGDGNSLNQSLERAARVADFLELGELMCRDALAREESCGCHFREEYEEAGECKRNDEQFAHAAVWEWQGEEREPVRHVEPIEYERVHFTTRSYK
jgi:succinate dehydrogenase / fumarate reductase flavoprotein subunit